MISKSILKTIKLKLLFLINNNKFKKYHKEKNKIFVLGVYNLV